VSEPATPPNWQVAALVGRVGSRDILVQDGVASPTLPTADRPIEIEPFAADALAVVEGMLGVAVVPLRLTWLPTDEWRSGTIVVETEPLDAAPTGFRWQDPSDVRETLAPEQERSVVRRWIDRFGGEAALLEPPWAREGWFARTSAWMVERMADAGLPIAEAPRLVYQGPLAAVLRARSDRRAMFLKCAAPAFANEASITHALGRRTPEAVPAVLASDAGENWLLMEDHGGRLLEPEPDDAWVEALRGVAALQRAWIGFTHEVSAAGGQTRPLERLASAIPQMLDRDGLGDRMTREVREAWIAATPKLVQACAALIDVGLPDTLVHGDLHPGNIVVTPNGYVVVDWSDAAVGNPFVDLPTFLLRTKSRDLRRRLLDVYVDGWDGFHDRAKLDVAADVAMTVGALYQVATYQALLPAMDAPDRALLDGADVSWVKRALDALDHGIDAGLT
jgi:Phosphotransferase enzyme family